MYTVEFIEDYCQVVTLDENNRHTDVTVFIEDAGVFIQQYPDYKRNSEPNLIYMSFQQFKDVMDAMSMPEGIYNRIRFNARKEKETK